ncbi:unnamed protein product [Ceutorhynchus assimilis]|uniref:Tudor domain-containing protein n=1 Tax=Ceutorhynchus assimilis TaxID=467358 RepID=A0A9N9MND0_9CUCU|nr:unnamed protein product [Ceutorhynchus assimilis]
MSISTLENNSKSPTHIATDWNFFLNEVLTERVQITPYYDKEDWKIGEIYSMRVSHIYDPSHFWVVTKHLEMDLLHRYLNDFYSKHNNHYKLPEENLKLNLYCVVYTEGAYYRGILVKIPYMMKKKTWVFVYLLDFGFMSKVLPDNIYFMTKDMYSVKHFAIRACLAGQLLEGAELTVLQASGDADQLIVATALQLSVTEKSVVVSATDTDIFAMLIQRYSSENDVYMLMPGVQDGLGHKLDATQFGWREGFGRLLPVISDDPPAPDSLLKLFRCGCTTGYNQNCWCRRASMPCKSYCARCEGNCTNNEPVVLDDAETDADEDIDDPTM